MVDTKNYFMGTGIIVLAGFIAMVIWITLLLPNAYLSASQVAITKWLCLMNFIPAVVYSIWFFTRKEMKLRYLRPVLWITISFVIVLAAELVTAILLNVISEMLIGIIINVGAVSVGASVSFIKLPPW